MFFYIVCRCSLTGKTFPQERENFGSSPTPALKESSNLLSFFMFIKLKFSLIRHLLPLTNKAFGYKISVII